MKKMPAFIKPLLACLLILITLWNIGSAVWSVSSHYTSRDLDKRYAGLKFAYEDSQYANKNFTSWIPDEPVNTYAGMAYVKGVNPVLIAADTPPLGRYMIGVSGIMFNNENIITLIAGAVSLLFLFLLGRQIFSSNLLALIPPALLSFEPLFRNQFIYTPLLDLMQLMFLLPFFYVFNIAIKKKKNYIWLFALANILIGCFIATKFFVSGITLVAAAGIVLLLNFDKKKIIAYIVTFPLAIIVLLLTYTRAYFDEPDFRSFLGIQKYVYVYHQSQLMFPFSIWPFIYLNQWHVWWGDKPVITDNQWTLMWPITTTLSIVTSIAYFFKKFAKRIEAEILIVWAIVYLLFFSIGQITPRYLVILLPVLYLLSVYGVVQVTKMILVKRKK